MHQNELLREKVYESVTSVLPITLIVLVLSISIAPLTPGTLTLFLFGAVLLIVGMGFFTLGVDMSMIPMGDGIGVEISRAKGLILPLLTCLILGIVVTIAEPSRDLTGETSRERDEALGVLAQKIQVDARLDVKALNVRH